jgi:hypothetical protein
MSNPWMSLWLSAANSWASAARGFWTAELHRQQTDGSPDHELLGQNLDGAGRRPRTEASPLIRSGRGPH